jgi:hypothetical protein
MIKRKRHIFLTAEIMNNFEKEEGNESVTKYNQLKME